MVHTFLGHQAPSQRCQAQKWSLLPFESNVPTTIILHLQHNDGATQSSAYHKELLILYYKNQSIERYISMLISTVH